MRKMTGHSTPTENKAFVKITRDGMLDGWLQHQCRRDDTKAWASYDMYEHFETWVADVNETPFQMTPQRKSAFFIVLAELHNPPKKTLRRGKENNPTTYTLGWAPLDGVGRIEEGDWLTNPELPRGLELKKLIRGFVFDCVHSDRKKDLAIRWSCNGVYVAFEHWLARKNGGEVVTESDRRKNTFLQAFTTEEKLKKRRVVVRTGEGKTRRAWVYPGIEPRYGAVTPEEPWWDKTKPEDD